VFFCWFCRLAAFDVNRSPPKKIGGGCPLVDVEPDLLVDASYQP
jgi:hypothetical protein